MSCGHLTEDIPECPLCLEPFALDDINFYPCSCRYQICRFCWHRIRTDENGLCPHCREPYSENPAEYTPPSQDQLVKLKHDKKQKTHDKKQKLIESRKNLSSLRVVQKNLVFVIGLSPRLAEPDILRKNEYFGKYGKIYKVVINNSTVYNGVQGPSVSAYVTYYREEDASKAIQAVNNAFIDGRHLKASYGTTKYCTYFLRGSQCTKPDCMYLHEMGNEEASFTKEDMQAGKHQVFESQTLAASNTGASTVGREQGGQGSSKKQDPLLKGVREFDSESALPATASWGMRQASGGLLPLPPLKEPKSHSSKPSKSQQKSQKHAHSKSDGSGGKSSMRGARSSPLSPHSILGPGPGAEAGGTTRRHNSTGSHSECSSNTTRSANITRSNSTVVSGSSKSVSPNLSPKSSLSTSSSTGSLKQDMEGRGGGGGEGGGGGSEGKNSERETSRDAELAKPHPLELAVSRQLDSMDLDDDDDWGLQEVRATTDVITDNTADTVTTAADTTNAPSSVLDSSRGLGGRERQQQQSEGRRDREKPDAVDAVLSSLGSTATGQFGSLGVSWNYGAPSISSNVPPPLPPSQFSAPGEQVTAQQHEERNQTPDDDLGFDPWDVSARGLAALLETEQTPSSDSRTSQSDGESGRGDRGDGGVSTLPGSTVTTMDSTANLSWQDELKTIFPNVNISFGGPNSSPSSGLAPRSAPLTAAPSPSATSQTPLQQAINGAAAQSLSFPYHRAGVGGMGALFGYTSPNIMSDYRSLYEAAASTQSSLTGAARSAFEAPKTSHSTNTTPDTFMMNSATTSDASSVATTNGGKGFTGPNSIDWPELASTSVSAVGSRRAGGKTSSNGGAGGTLSNASNVATWNGSTGNGGTKDTARVIGTTNSTAKSKESSGAGAVAPPPGFTTKTNKDNMTLSSSVNHVLWNNSLGKGTGAVQAGVATQQTANPAMANQILQNWAKYLQMNFGGLTPQQLASNPLYQQMVRQQQQYWVMLRQQQLLQLQQAGVGGVSVPGGRPVLTPAQIQQLQTRMALSQSALNQATAHARLQHHHLQQSLQQQQQQVRNSLGHIGVPATAIPVSGQATTGQAVRLGQSPGAAAGVLLKSTSQSSSTNRPSQSSQNMTSK